MTEEFFQNFETISNEFPRHGFSGLRVIFYYSIYYWFEKDTLGWYQSSKLGPRNYQTDYDYD